MTKAAKVDDRELRKLCSTAMSATKTLKEIMEVGFATRVTADYDPDRKIDFNKGRHFTLNGIDIMTARDWPAKTQVMTGTISIAWNQLYG